MARLHRWKQAILLMAVLGLLTAMVLLGQQVKKVDEKALANAAKNADEWVTYNHDWSETRFSPLKQIDATNVNRLGLAWYVDIPTPAPQGAGAQQNHQEATALFSNGFIYSITPWSTVFAVDARTGKELWHSDPQVNQAVWQSRICCGVVNRGIAMFEGKIIAPVVDGRLRALDIQTGKLIWETRVSPENQAYTITMAPRVIKNNKVVVGVSGGEYSVRGFFAAFDTNTGKRSWIFYTVPGDPSKPFENSAMEMAAKTWTGEWWKMGGGAGVWEGMAYDPDEDLLYVGTGQPGPWTEFYRGKGDNLFANSIVAVKGATGKYVWHYQEVPGDDWDFDSIADIMLADIRIDGKVRKVVMHAPKDGIFYVLDRVTGKFISGDPFTKVSWTTGIDQTTGRPTIAEGAHYGTTPVNVVPGPAGGHSWSPWSFNPNTGLVYIPGTSGGGYTYQATPGFEPRTTIIDPPTGRGQMQTGEGAPRGGGRGAAAPAPAPGIDPNAVAAGVAPAAGGNAVRGGGGAAAPPAVPPSPALAATPGGGGRLLVFVLDGKAANPGVAAAAAPAAPGAPPLPAAPAAPGGGAGGGRGAGGGAPGGVAAGGGGAGAGAGGGGGARGGGAAQTIQLPQIGPDGARGSVMWAWDPVARKERWRVPNASGGAFNGGTLSTGGNLVFTTVANRLLAFKADTGESVLDLTIGLLAPNPPMTFLLDGKQYIVVAGGVAPTGGGAGGGAGAGGGGRGGGGRGAGAGAPGGGAAPARGQ